MLNLSDFSEHLRNDPQYSDNLEEQLRAIKLGKATLSPSNMPTPGEFAKICLRSLAIDGALRIIQKAKITTS